MKVVNLASIQQPACWVPGRWRYANDCETIMVAPTSGPFQKTVTTSTHYHDRRVWKQAKPIDRPLPFTGRYADLRYALGQQEFFAPLPNAVSWMENNVPTNLIDAARAKAYEGFRGQISDQSAMGVFLVELEQAASMIARRGLQIVELIRAARKADFGRMNAILRRDFKPSTSKGFANIWLEYSFGWSPMIKDIHSAVDVLQNPIKAIMPIGKGTGGQYDHTSTSGSFPNEASRTVWSGKVFSKTGAQVTVSNPNLFLANNLGLVNPFTVAWELIPFSFVVDWFIPVENFLSYGSDLYGLSVTNAWATLFVRGSTYDYQKSVSLGRYGERWVTGAYMTRSLGLIGPTIFVKPFKVPSWKRALNAISLVVQNLGGR